MLQSRDAVSNIDPAGGDGAGRERQRRGKLGERAAERHLRQAGYKVLVKNYRGRWGELDLVCRHEGTLVFVEVKARGPNSWGTPAAAVTATKQRRVISTAYEYLGELKTQDMPVRFDVVEIFLGADGEVKRCQIIPSAFELTRKNRHTH
ncbi:MAG: YraN family protein [Verrucomicrobiales bacterium]|nr:YraN family protein [Verrucomicrobiales bacterium]